MNMRFGLGGLSTFCYRSDGARTLYAILISFYNQLHCLQQCFLLERHSSLSQHVYEDVFQVLVYRG